MRNRLNDECRPESYDRSGKTRLPIENLSPVLAGLYFKSKKTIPLKMTGFYILKYWITKLSAILTYCNEGGQIMPTTLLFWDLDSFEINSSILFTK